MSFSEVMLWLSINYKIGMAVSCFVIVAIYLIISIRILIGARNAGLDVSASSMIPLYNLSIVIRTIIAKHKKPHEYTEDEEIIL